MQQQKFLSLDQLTHMPAPVWMIDGLFEANSLTMLAGPPGCYKSFMALDWMLCMATGRRWFQRATMPCKVLYILGEGKSSLLKRIAAWVRFNGLTPEEENTLNQNFRVTFEVPQMVSKPSVDNFLAALQAEAFQPNLLVIDTLARSFVGMDENSQKDCGLWIESAERLRALNYTVLWLHHTAKNTEFGLKYRGSSVILGAVDTAITMQRDSGHQSRVTMKVTKQKDHDEGNPLQFIAQKVMTNGNPEGSCVLVPSAVVDERYSVEGQKTDRIMMELIENPNFASDRDRAKELAKHTDLSESAAQSRISRRRQAGL